MTKLEPMAVHTIFMDCLFDPEEIVNGEPSVPAIAIEGITMDVGLHAGRVAGHKAEIRELVDQVPEIFKNGMTFLNLCEDKDGNQWTGMHLAMQELVFLGIAAGYMKYCAPKDMWSILPGGMPYVQVNL